MSFNITRFKLKEIKDLRIPVKSLFPEGAENHHPERYNNDDGSVEFILSAGGGVSGRIVGDILEVDDFGSITDDGSGYAMEDVLLPALRESTGFVKFSLIWESGEAIESIVVEDGNVVRTDIDV